MPSFTGGAELGWFNASWPFARLEVSAERLVLEVAFFGKHAFTPEEVVSVVPNTGLFGIGAGIRIHHVKDYTPKKVTFMGLRPRATFLKAIDDAGFVPSADEARLEHHQSGPFRMPFLIWATFVYVLFSFAGFHLFPQHPELGMAPLMLLSGALMLATSLGIRRPGWFQEFALQAPECLPNIRAFLNMVTLWGIGALLFGGAFVWAALSG